MNWVEKYPPQYQNWLQYLVTMNPSSINLQILIQIIKDLAGEIRTEPKFIHLIPDPELTPLDIHQPGLTLIIDEDDANFHLQITELQRLEWIDLSIDQALQPNHQPLITGLWTKYIELLRAWFVQYQLPVPEQCEKCMLILLDRYEYELQNGSTDDFEVINYSLEILFWGLTTASYENPQIYMFLAQFYQYIKIGRVIEFDDIQFHIRTALMKRNCSYISSIFKNKKLPSQRLDIITDVSSDFFCSTFRQQCYNRLHQQYFNRLSSIT